ncbi:MAG: hypothetical protein KAT49_04125 [Methanomicrobia archaeon]|nr:hypothetical protein [Methanomicrobia archaeon]
MDDVDIKKSFEDNKILFLLLPVLGFFFTIIYTLIDIESIFFVIFLSFIISFILSFSIGHIRKNPSLGKNINYIIPLMGILIYYEFFSIRKIDIILFLGISVIYCSFLPNFILSKILKNKIISYSLKSFIPPKGTNVKEDISKNKFLTLIECSKSDLGEIYETYIESSTLKIFIEKNKNFISIFCFEILNNKILKTLETEGIIEVFSKMFKNWTEKKKVDKKIIDKVFEPYILKMEFSRKTIAPIVFLGVIILIVFKLGTSNVKNFLLENKKEVFFTVLGSLLTFLFAIMLKFFGGRKK